MRELRMAAIAGCLMVLAGCQTASQRADATAVFPDNIKGLGTEPFWSLEIEGGRLSWTDIDHPSPRRAAIVRQEIDGELRLTGVLDGKALRGDIRHGECSDGMSDRTYPFSLSLFFGERQFNGCAHPANMVLPTP